MTRIRVCAVLLLACAGAAPAVADEAIEDKLRDALRHTTVDLRDAQDQAAAAQAALDAANKQKDLLQAQLDQANAKLAAQDQQAKQGPSPKEQAAMQQAAAMLAAAKAENAGLRQDLAKWRAAYEQAATIARGKDAEARTTGATLKTTAQGFQACKAANVKLVATANDILHLYQSRDFRATLLGSYEPLLGYKRVELENIVQDYEDKIQDQVYVPGVPVADNGGGKR